MGVLSKISEKWHDFTTDLMIGLLSFGDFIYTLCKVLARLQRARDLLELEDLKKKAQDN